MAALFGASEQETGEKQPQHQLGAQQMDQAERFTQHDRGGNEDRDGDDTHERVFCDRTGSFSGPAQVNGQSARRWIWGAGAGIRPHDNLIMTTG
jgi:hypothetical protein